MPSQAKRGNEVVLVSEALHEQNVTEIAKQIAKRSADVAWC